MRYWIESSGPIARFCKTIGASPIPAEFAVKQITQPCVITGEYTYLRSIAQEYGFEKTMFGFNDIELYNEICSSKYFNDIQKAIDLIKSDEINESSMRFRSDKLYPIDKCRKIIYIFVEEYESYEVSSWPPNLYKELLDARKQLQEYIDAKSFGVYKPINYLNCTADFDDIIDDITCIELHEIK